MMGEHVSAECRYILEHYSDVYVKDDYGFHVKEPSPLSGKDGLDSFSYFFPLNGSDNLEYTYSVYQQQVPENLIPIASIDGGNLLCMNIDNGKIYIWIHDNAEQDTYFAGNDIEEIVLAFEKGEGLGDDLGIVSMQLSDRLMNAITNYKA